MPPSSIFDELVAEEQQQQQPASKTPSVFDELRFEAEQEKPQAVGQYSVMDRAKDIAKNLGTGSGYLAGTAGKGVEMLGREVEEHGVDAVSRAPQMVVADKVAGLAAKMLGKEPEYGQFKENIGGRAQNVAAEAGKGVQAAGRKVQEAGDVASEYWTGKLSEPGRQLSEMPWYKADGIGNKVMAATLQAAKSAPETLAIGLAGGPVSATLKGAGVGAMLTKALGRTGVSRKLAPKIASWVEEGLAYGSAEGLSAGLSNAKQVGEEIEKMDHARLMAGSPAYQEYYNQTGDEAEAKRLLRDDAEAMALGATAVLSTATGAAAGGGLFDKTLTSKNFLLNRVLGGIKEGHQEFWQSGIGEALPANLAMRKAEPDRSAMEGVWEEGAAGAGPGFIMGLFGASGGRHEQEGGQDKTEPSVAYLNNQAVAELKKRNWTTRDLLRLRNSPEIGQLGIEPRHIDAILDERAQELEQARFTLGGDEQGPLTRAAKQTVAEQHAEIILGMEKERREAQLAGDIAAFDREYARYQPDVPEHRSLAVEEIKRQAAAEEEMDGAEQFRRELEEVEEIDPEVRKYAAQRADEIVNADPVYAHMYEAKGRGLDLNALQQDYDKETTTAIARKYPAIFSYNGRVKPDEFAQEKGYESLDHMIQAFMSAPSKNQLIARIARDEEANFRQMDNLMERDTARGWTGAGTPVTADITRQGRYKGAATYPAPDADIDAMAEVIRANPEAVSDEDLDHWTYTSAQKAKLRAARRKAMVERTGARPGAVYTMAQPSQGGTGATETTAAAETGKEEGGKERGEFIPATTGPVTPQGRSAQDFLIRQRAAGTAAAGNLEKQAVIPEKYSGRSDDFKKGYADFLTGRERVEPEAYHGAGGKGAEWYRGWDAANVDAPVTSQQQPAGETQRGPAIPDFKSSKEINEWIEAQAEARGMSSVEYTTTDEYKGVHSQLRQKFDELRKQEEKTEAADARIVRPVRREDGKYWLKRTKGKGYIAAPGAFGTLSGTAQQFDTEQEALEWAEKEGYTIEPQPQEAQDGLQQEGQGKAEVVKPGFGEDNKVFTKDAAEKAREILRAKLKTQLSAGLDPEMMQAGITLAGYYIEGGTRKFADYSKAMVNDLGEGIRPYLKAFYDAIRSWPGFNAEGMSTPEQVEKYLAQGGEKVIANVGDKVYFTATSHRITKEMAGTVEKVYGDHDSYMVRGENGFTYPVFPNAEEGTDTMRPAWGKQGEKGPEKPSTAGMSPELEYRTEYRHWLEAGRKGEPPEVPEHLANNPGVLQNIQRQEESAIASKEKKQHEGKGRALARFENKEDGIAVSVFPHEKGFSVVMMDTDSGEMLNTVKIFPGKTEAINYAQEIAAGKQTQQPATPHELIADKVARRLKNRQRISWAMLFRMADEAYGGTQAEGKYVAKDAYDAMELGVNKYLLEKGFGNYSYNIYYGGNRGLTHRAVKDLKELIDLLPTQTRRSAEQDEFQQFSTPPPLAYLANWVANLNENDVYLEPSAGIGGLAVFGKMAGAEVIVNELSERRRGLLASMGFDRVTGENAEHLNSILPKDIRPTVIVMNPPFSATAGRVEGKRDTRIGARHIEQALKRLQPGGRLVAIVGEGMAHDKPAFREWWRKIESEYTVRANVGMSGKEYRKYGTTFDNQLLIIDKTGPTIDNIIKDRVEKVEDLIPLLEEVRNVRATVHQEVSRPGGETQPVANQPAGQEEADTGKGAAVGGHAALPPAGGMGTGPAGSAGGTQGSGRVPVPQGEPGQGDETPAGGRSEIPVEGEDEPGGSGDGDTGAAGQQADGGDRGLQQQGGSEVTPGIAVEAVDQQHDETLTDSIYENYSPERVKIPGAKPHPTPLVQSAAMASVKPPKPTYSPSIPQRAIDAGKISDIQLEAVVYAGQAMEQMLPDGETRQGYFIGDGTGVGKGREIAAILWDNWNKGRKKGVWISEKKPLFDDAKRDLRGVGWRDNQLINHGKVKAADKIAAREGILFTTYDTVKAGERREGGRTRLDQIVEWLGEDFDGVVAFDESHNMGNSMAVKKKRGRSRPSAKALEGIKLQQRLPKARVLYVSATGATEVMNLAYADRLGLWGRGTPFANKMEFVNQVSAGGMAVMEMIARDMKARGLYTARSLSYDGVEYDRLEHVLSDSQRAAYDRMAEGWQVVLRNINAALEETGGAHDATAKSNAFSAFWGAHQRFFNQYLIALQMPSVIKQMRKDLEAGHAIVVQLTSTYEAPQERALAKVGEDGNLEDLDISPFDTLMEYVQNSFPVAQFQPVMDQDGNVTMQLVVDSEGNVVQNADAVAMRERLLDELGALRKDVADNPIDQIIDEFGIDTVGEVTGRKRRVVWKETEDKGRQRVVEKRPASSGAADAQAFMDDRKRVLIFSEAGGTGRSYHADRSEKNQRKRIHYLLQPGWRADKAVQGLGRTHRSNQAHPPKYILVTTDLKGQKRFLSTIARRLDQLGALTKGQRQTGSQGIFAARDNLESQYAVDALRRFFQDLVNGQVAGITVQEFEEQTGLRLTDDEGGFNTSNLPTIQQFLNRLLSLKIETMDTVFDEFSARMEAIIEAHARAGTLDVGVETLHADSVEKVEDEVVHIDERTGAETKYIRLRTVNPAPILTFEAARQNYAKNGFFKNRASGKIWAVTYRDVTNRDTGDVVPTAVLRSVTYSEQRIKLSEFTEDKWERIHWAGDEWQAAIDAAPKTVTRDVHLISGALLPVWDRLSGGYARVVRVQTDQGERMIGRIIPDSQLQETLRKLGVSKAGGATKVKLTPAEIHSRVLDQNYTVRLVNDWTIVRRRVSGDDRIEIKGMSLPEFQNYRKDGIFSERIEWNTRFFIPAGKEGVKTIEAITRDIPVLSATPPAGAEYGAADGASLFDRISDEGGTYEVQGTNTAVVRDRSGDSGVQLQLFTNAEDGRKQEKFIESYPARIGTFYSDFETIENAAQAAQLLSPIAARSQEVFAAVVLDKDKKPIAVLQHSIGTTTSNQVASGHFVGSIHNLKGADSVWIAHNHPSGRMISSQNDKKMTRLLHNALRGTGVSLNGHIIMAPTGQATLITDLGDQEFTFNPPARKSNPVRVTERRLRGNRLELLDEEEITSSRAAKKALSQYSRGLNGILFLDTGHRPIRFIHATLADMQALRRGEKKGLAAKLYRFIDKRNSASAVIVNMNGGTAGEQVNAGQNLVNFFSQAQISLLDIIAEGDSLADQGVISNMRNTAQVSDYVFHSRRRGRKAGDAGFARQLDRYVTGDLPGSDPLLVGDTPAVLRLLGADSLPVVINRSTVDKVLREKHGLPLELLKQLPRQLADPIMVFGSASERDGLVVMTELQHEGKTVVAAVHLNNKAGRLEVNRVASVYGKDSDRIFAKWINDGLLRYRNKRKSRRWAMTRGLQLPKVRGTNRDLSVKKILSENDLVKFSAADEQDSTGATPGQVMTELREFLGKGLDNLTGQGKLEVVRTEAGLPAHIGRFLKMVAWHGSPHRFQQESRVKDANGKIIAHYAANETIPSDIAQRVRDGEYTVETLRHGRFRADKIGTGEGVQAYGHGLYFSDRREVAEWYRNQLSERVGYEYKGRMYNDSQYEILEEHLVEDFNLNEADRKLLFDLLAEGVEEGKKIGQSWLKSAKEELFAAKTEFQRQVAESQIAKLKKPVAAINSIKYFKPGAVYKVELAPKEDEYLLWDKPLSEQSEKVRKALREAYEKASGDWKLALAHSWDSEDSGKYLYFGLADEIRGKGKIDIEISPNRFERIEDPEEGASAFLHSIGIRGIKYLDGTSRAKGEGAYNYVIFSDEDIEITAMYSRDGEVIGAYDPATGKIWLVSDQMMPEDAKYVFIHEAGHALLREDKQFMAQREKILARFEGLKDRSERIKAAFDKVPNDTPAENVTEEAMMYFLQDKANHRHSIFRRVVAAVKAALARLGVPVDRLALGEADFVALFTGGAKRWAHSQTGVLESKNLGFGISAKPAYSQLAKSLGISIEEAKRQYEAVEKQYRGTDRWMKAPNGKPTKLNERQWVQVRTPAFKEWFGDWELAASLKATEQFISDVEAGERPENVVVGAVSGRVAGRIKHLTGVNVKGARFELVANDVAHALKEHGNQEIENRRTPPQEAITVEDLKLLPIVLAEPSNITHGSIQDGRRSVRFKKKINGTLVVVEIVPSAGGSMLFKTAWKRPSERTDAVSPGHTPEAALSPPHSYSKTIQQLLEKSNASKVVDENGEPLVVYHGTDTDFSEFSMDRAGKNVEGNASNHAYEQTAHIGYWFNSAPMAGRKSTPFIDRDMPVFLNIRNPWGSDIGLDLDSLAGSFEFYRIADGKSLRKKKSAEGYDGVQIHDEEFGGTSYVAFSPNQIKSAIGNTGQFSQYTNDIRYSRQAPGPESFDDTLNRLLGKDPDTVVKETRKEIRKEGLTVGREAKHARAVAAGTEKQPSPEEMRTWWDRLEEKSKQMMLGALTLRQIREIFGPKSIHVARFYQATRDMAADTNQMMAEADKVYGEFAALPKQIADELADIMTRATVDGVDPTRRFTSHIKGENPSDERIARDKHRRAAHKKLKARFDALAEQDPRVRDVWRNVRQTYDTNLQRLRDALLERLMRTAGRHDRRILKEFYALIFHGKTITPATIERLIGKLSGEGRAVIRFMDQVRLRFERYIQEGPYFPLSRFGPYVVVATKPYVGREVRTFETMKQRDQYVAEKKREGWNIKTTYSKNYSSEVQGVSNSFVEGVIQLIDGSGMERTEKMQVLDDLNQLFIQTIPDLSHRKHFAHRQKIEGYSRDQLRAFAETMQHAAHHISRIRHADKLTTALREMDQDLNKARTGHHEELRHVWNELSERLEKQIMKPNIHPVAQALTSLGFAWNIGPSIASALVNLSQTPLVAYPMMAARFKAKRGAAVELTRASNDYFHSPFELDKGCSMAESDRLSDDEREMIRRLIADGTIDVTQAHSLAQAAAPDYLNLAKTAHGHKMLQVMRIVSYPFHVAEVANRQITALAAYRLARSKGMDHRNAISEARELTLDSHFDYSQTNRSRYMEGNARRVLFLFKQYSQQMTFLLGRSFQQAVSKGVDPETKRIARTQLAGILGGHFLVSGLMGMPVIGTIADIMAFFINGLGDDDDPFDWEVELRNLLADTVGKSAGEAIAVGPARMIPLLGQWDVSTRMSLGDLWLRTPDRVTEGRDKFNQWLNLFAGPIASNVANMFQGAHAWSEGYHLRGVEMAMPKAIKDGFRTIRYAREGLRSWNDDTLIDELGYMELFGQMLGFNPSRVSEMYAGKSAIKNRQTRIERRRQRLINAWVRATRDGDMERAREAMEKMVMFNRKNPAFTITGGTLARSYRQRLNVQAGTRQGVYLPARKAGLRHEGRFANID